MAFGSERYRYEVNADWATLPTGWQWGWIPAVACDSEDRVYVYSRSDHHLVIFDREGGFLEETGADIFRDAHGIYIDGNDSVYCTEHSSHCVYKLSSEGDLLLTLGRPGMCASNEKDPFNKPTDAAVSSTGEIFVSDGYGHKRMHKYSPDGELLLSWGEPGDDDGCFALPHCVRVDRYDRVWVCDRENDRIQIFDTDGKYLEKRTGLKRPDAICFDPDDDVVYVAEFDYRVTILSLDGDVIAQWGDGKPSSAPGEFSANPHGICVDSRGDLYVSEVQESGRLQKFIRQH